MKKIFHKNQLIITALALLIAVVGYISYDQAGKKSGEKIETMNEQGAINSAIKDSLNTGVDEAVMEASEDKTEQEDGIDNPGETILTSSIVNVDDYAAGVKMNREQVRSKNRESLTEIIDNENLSDEQKQKAVDQMVEMTDIAQKEANAEMLLEAKGFTDVVVSISDGSCDVVVNMQEVTDAKLAQVEDIVKRKTDIDAANIVITPIEVTP